MRQVSLKDSDRGTLIKSLGQVKTVTADLSIYCKDGTVHTHQALIAWASSYVRRMFVSQLLLEEGGKRKEHVALHLPDYQSKVVSALTSFLTSGELKLKAGRQFQQEFQSLWEELKVDRVHYKDVFMSGLRKLSDNRRQSPFNTPSIPTIKPFVTKPLSAMKKKSITPSQTLPISPSRPLPMTPSRIRPMTPSLNRSATRTQNMMSAPPGPPGPLTQPSLSILQSKGLTITSDSGSEVTLSSQLPDKLSFNREVSVTITSEPSSDSGDVPKIIGIVGKIPDKENKINSVTNVKKIDNIKRPGRPPLLSRNIGSRGSRFMSRGKSLPPKKVLGKPPKFIMENKADFKKPTNIRNKESVMPERKSKRSSLGTFSNYNEDSIENAIIEKARISNDLKMQHLKEKILKSKKKVIIPLKRIKVNNLPKLNNTQQAVSIVRASLNNSTITTPSNPYMATPSKITITPSLSIKKDDFNDSTNSIVFSKGITKDKLTINQNKASINTIGIKKKPKKKELKNKKVANIKTEPVLLPQSTKDPLSTPSKSEVNEYPDPLLSTSSVSITRTYEPLSTTSSSCSMSTATVSITRAVEIIEKSEEIESKERTIRLPAVSITKSSETDLVQNISELEPITCYICNQTKDKEHRDLNLRNVFYVRSHISKCLYKTGKLFRAIPPGKDNTATDGFSPLDEFGLRAGIWYNCEVEGCWLAQKGRVAGQVCYKVFAIHMASQHGALEMVMLEDGDRAREIVEKLMDHEERKKSDDLPNMIINVKKENFLDVTLEENVMSGQTVNAKKSVPSKISSLVPSLGPNGEHNCFLCSSKEGLKLSFKDIRRLKDHYARCLYNESQLVQYVSPGPDNSDDRGNALDETSLLYRCEVKGCSLQRKKDSKGRLNFKTFALHMATEHGVLETVMESRPFMQDILRGLVTAENSRTDLVKCRFSDCSGKFKVDNVREVKLHYAGYHFSRLFKLDTEAELAQAGFSKSGSRAVCSKCTDLANGKPVYIQTEVSAIRGHLVVKHDLLSEVLMKADSDGVKEAYGVMTDLYPEKVKGDKREEDSLDLDQHDKLAQIYMDSLDSSTTGQLNLDFMDKISL